MKKAWVCLVLVTILFVSALGMSGCNETSTQDDGQLDTTNGGIFFEMLTLIPDNETTRFQVYINDFAKIREIYNISLPPSDADDNAIMDYIDEILNWDETLGAAGGYNIPRRVMIASFVSGMGGGPGGGMSRSLIQASPIRKQNIGFGPQDVDVDISAGYSPLIHQAIKGRFDPAAVADALNQYDESIMPNTSSYQGFTTYDWGPNTWAGPKLSPPVFDQIGCGGTIAVHEDYIFRSLGMDNMELMIDASQGRTANLADNSDFGPMATALSEMGAYSIFLTDQVWNREMLETRAEYDESINPEEIVAAAGQLLRPYNAYGYGIGKDEEGHFMTLVLVYDSPQQASSDVSVLEQHIESGTSVTWQRPWRDRIDSWEVTADGRVLQAVLRGDIVYAWSEIFFWPDTLLLQGEE